MTQISETYRVDMNGVIDTGRSVMQNIENMANSSYAWSTYDITTGKWSVIINRPGTSTKSFDADNIISAVDLSITPLDRLYNAVEIQFPDRTLDDANRMVRAEMLPADLKQNEPENVLRLTYPLINDQIRALTLGLTELKQSRLDKIISFVTNFTANGLRAGDIIDITIDTYNFTNKLFRVLEVAEVDTDAGDFNLRITGIEYSDSIYEHDTSKFTLSNDDGIFSLGNILPMDPITVTLTEEDQLPFVLIESAFNTAGAPVTGVEVWAYNVTDPTEIANWNNPALYPDDERAYTLLTTKNAIDESFVLGADFDHKIYDLGAGNWLIKIRPVNALTTGPFTTPGALTTYEPNIANGISGDLLSNDVFKETLFLNFSYNNYAANPSPGSAWGGSVQGGPASNVFSVNTLFFTIISDFGHSSPGLSCSSTVTAEIINYSTGVAYADIFGRTQFVGHTSDASGSTSMSGLITVPSGIPAGTLLAINLSFTMGGSNPPDDVHTTVEIKNIGEEII